MWWRLLTLTSVMTLFMALLLTSHSAEALPKNFRNVDVFYVGAMPNKGDIEEMATLGIQHIISLHRMPGEVSKHAKRLGIEVHNHPWRTRLEDVEVIMAIVDKAPTNTVFLHCMHGADRTGAATAYWLHTRRGYGPFLALATVITPKTYHLRGLEMLAREYSYNFAVVDKLMFGRFSGARNGGLEGLKLRGGRWYTRLARNFLEITIGPPLHEPSRSFWGYEQER